MTAASLFFHLAAFFGTMEASNRAFAHASLVQSAPADGGVLSEAPQLFILTFSEPVSPIVIRLVEADGTGSDLSQVRAEDETVVIIAPPLGAGTHALSWRVVSADGHPVGGSIVFSIGDATTSAILVRTHAPRILMALIWGARLLLYFGVFFGIGGRFFAAWIAPERPLPPIVRRVVLICLVAGLGSAMVSIGSQGLDARGVDFAQLLDWSVWRAGLSSSYATTLAVIVSALALALASNRFTSLMVRRESTAIAIFGVGAAFVLSGHASTAPPQALTQPAIFVHGVCITFWVGSLVPLAALVRSGGPPATAALVRFSRAIPVPLALLVASGVLLAIVQLGQVSALWRSAYGLVFDAKITAVIILFGFAAWNRFRLTPSAESGEAIGRRAMVRSIAAETVLVAAILGLVTTWRFTPPPRASAASVASIHVHFHGAKAMAAVSITPGRAGLVEVSIAVVNLEFSPLNAEGVTLTLSSPASGIEPISREARHVGGATWRVDTLTVPASGKWIGKIVILVSDFEEITLRDEFDVPR